MARLTRRNRRGKKEWYIKYLDPHSEKWRWISCIGRGATNESLRKALLKQVEDEEEERRVEVRRIGSRPRYDTILDDLIKQYLSEIKTRVDARGDRTDRAGMATGTAREYRVTLAELKAFAPGVTTGEMDGDFIRRFKASLQTPERAPATVNKHLRALRAFLNRFDDANPPYFRGPVATLFGKALIAVPGGRGLPVVLEPDDLTALVGGALEMDRTKGHKSPASLFRSVALHALTGARTHEIAALTWGDVNLDAGQIILRAKKTGRERTLPLVGDPSGDVSPGLLRLLASWRDQTQCQSGNDGIDALPVLHPIHPRKPWEALRRATVAEGKPKAFRSTWTSYLVTMGRAPSVVAWWAGHSMNVLERHYANYVRGRREGATLDEAMGLTGTIERALDLGT